jgi:hypothetical protein
MRFGLVDGVGVSGGPMVRRRQERPTSWPAPSGVTVMSILFLSDLKKPTRSIGNTSTKKTKRKINYPADDKETKTEDK